MANDCLVGQSRGHSVPQELKTVFAKLVELESNDSMILHVKDTILGSYSHANIISLNY